MKIDGKVLRDAREELGYSREMLARSAQLSQQTIAEMEHEPEYGPSLDRTVESLARALGMKPEELAPSHIPPVPHQPSVRYDKELLKNLRSERGLSHYELARRARLSEFASRDLEKRERPTARLATLYKIARALGLKPGDLAPSLRFPPAVGGNCTKASACRWAIPARYWNRVRVEMPRGGSARHHRHAPLCPARRSRR